MRNILLTSTLFAATAAICGAQNLQEFEKHVSEFTLRNGMHFIILERHEAPVVSFHAHVNSGTADDIGGKTGLAHMFEHMIGKGTPSLGTTNWPEEEKALKAVEIAYDKLDEELNKGRQSDKAQVERLEAALKREIEKANSYVVQNAFPTEIERNGGVGFNAGTSLDSTDYFYSLPSNRAELWFLLQSEWFAKPVYREFYKERDVVREERRMRIESNPQGKLLEALLSTAFTSQPYRTTIGWGPDIENLRASKAAEFHKVQYVPSNITVAIVGDITAAEARRMAEKYYGPIPAGPHPPRIVTIEPPQTGERRIAVESQSQPLAFIAYHRPDQTHPDDPVFDVLDEIISGGRTGILYKELVRDSKLCLAAETAASFPASKLPNLYVVLTVPNTGKTLDEIEKAWDGIIARLAKEPVDAATLKRVKTKIRAGLIRRLEDNASMASDLSSYYANYGDWRKMFTGIADIEKVTAADVQRVAKTYFHKNNETVAFITAPAAEAKN